MIRIRFSNATMRTIKARATDVYGRTYCEKCGKEVISRADYEYDHEIPEGIKLSYDPRLPLTAEHGHLLCIACHSRKTRRDVREISRAKRLASKHRVVGSGQSEVARRFGVKQEEPEK